ncbi:hypothetical protein INR49_017452 [Caranx melampygus]|nr:hypothetical protein INR49_017452 [Caranx melampygus]
MMERKRTDCPALPPGWKKEEVIRKSGLSAGKSDVYYYSPTGKKFRSKPQLSRYLGNTVDLGCFDFRTGKMMPGKMQKNKQRLRHDQLSLAKVTGRDHARSGEEGEGEGPWLYCGRVLCYQIIRLTQLFLQQVDSSAALKTLSIFTL